MPTAHPAPPFPEGTIENHPTLGFCCTRHEHDSMHMQWACGVHLWDGDQEKWVRIVVGYGSSRTSAREDAGFEAA